MEFTYSAYRNLIHELKRQQYNFADYDSCDNYERCVILRHDIDYSLDKSVELARIEAEEGVSSTYFVLLTSEFYNIFARENINKILEIHKLGHNIGLHFDEMNYEECNEHESVEQRIVKEAEIMSSVLGIDINSVSMHRPSKYTLEADYKFDSMINSYGKKFFKEFKYVSDSRRRWRENIDEIIKSKEYDKLHILTHAFWYNDENEDIQTTVGSFVSRGNVERYDILERNITDLKVILQREDV